jgi:uncharacterized protein
MVEHPDVALVRRGYQAFATGDVETLSVVIAEDATPSAATRRVGFW